MDRSIERRAALEARLEAAGCADRYTRFAAIDGRTLGPSGSPLTPGERGCFESHYRCIKESMGEEADLHILEDDAVLGPTTIPALDQTIDDALTVGEMVYTDIFVPGDLSTMIQLMNYYRLSEIAENRRRDAASLPSYVNFYDLKHASFTAASSYFVRRDARGRLLHLMEAELAAGPTTPVDMFYNRIVHAGELSAVVMLPFLTTVDPAAVLASTIGGRSQDDRSNLAFYMLRNFFFIDKDQVALARFGRDLTADLDDRGYMDTLLDVFRFLFSKDFVPI
ncbi:MAG TPA: glycosyltransferase family 25 protein [Caulobacteraceae bacterium]|nr:glycosyltransferase family 25 protein [Caulobacteraceae bacterium]